MKLTRFRLSGVAAALLAVLPAAHADEESLNLTEQMRQDLAKPMSTVEAGGAFVAKSSRRFGEYTGVTRDGFYAIANVDLVSRDDQTGTWLKLKGRNLGLENRELRFEHERQGDWSYAVDFSQTPRYEPFVVNTGLNGVGTNLQTVSGTGLRNLELKMERENLGLSFRKFVASGLEVRASFKQEEKEGSRLYGVANAGASLIDFLAEPVNRTTRQWEVSFDYYRKGAQLSGGYSGSAFTNHLSSISVAAAAPLGAPFALTVLPKSNQSHQLYLSGGYTFSDTTRGSFKVSHARATQDEPLEFEAGTPTLSPNRSLKGRLDTTLLYLNLHTTPVDQLEVTTNFRYEDRDDKTPVSQYIASALGSTTSGGTTGENVPRSQRQWKGFVEASYPVLEGYHLVGGLERDIITRKVPVMRRIAYRETTEDTSARLELKGAVSDSLNGSVAYINTRRGGSEFNPDTIASGGGPPVTPVSNQAASFQWSDRQRNRARVRLDWTPDEQWSVQGTLEESHDQYEGRSLGLRDGKTWYAALDASYAINENWKASAWISQEDSTADQLERTAATGNGMRLEYWRAQLRNLTESAGVSIKGKLNEKLKMGGELGYANHVAENRMQTLVPGTAGLANVIALDGLPDYFYRNTSIKFFADYQLERNSKIRFDFTHERMKTDDWTWQSWRYTDGTTVAEPQSQSMTYIGVSWQQGWR